MYVLQKLQDWLTDQDILGPEQAGFKAGKCTLDHCFILSHLISKYTSQRNTHLYAAFLDLKGAFDSIDRDI